LNWGKADIWAAVESFGGRSAKTINPGEISMKKEFVILVSVLSVVLAWMTATAQKQPARELKTHSAAVAVGEHKMLTPADLQWGDVPPGLPAGGQMAVLDGDPTKPGSFTVRLRAPAGYKVMPHSHPTPERVTVISGTFHLGMGEKFDENAGRDLGPGSFVILPAGMAHFAWTTDEGIIQINSEGPFQIKYVNPADDPRGTKK
jgi:hypothetical protein